MNKFPTLEKAILEIAYDNGVINRFQGKDVVLGAASTGLAWRFPEAELQAADNELSKLSEDELFELTCGEEGSVKVSGKLEEILNFVFDNI